MVINRSAVASVSAISNYVTAATVLFFVLFALESRAIKYFNFPSPRCSFATQSTSGEKQESRKMLCNFQQIEFLFLFDGDY